ncbi:MAG: 3-deoxy-7-phosphoheptulonate synthase [Acidobacteriota bacterium]
MNAKSDITISDRLGAALEERRLSMPVEQFETRTVTVGKVTIGDGSFVVLAGPCSIESELQFGSIAERVRLEGAAILRGGVYKLRTKPSSFQGLGTEAFDHVRKIKAATGMPIVSEITDPRQVEALHDLIDVFQVGTRNMYNYSLLKELGMIRKPVMLKRGMSALIDEWLNAAGYILAGGNADVILCERGIRTFETKMRNTLDLAAVAWIKRHTEFPVIVDPSHGTGRPELIGPMTLAAAAAGADGVLIEVHPEPGRALSDGEQAVDFKEFGELMARLRIVLDALGRPLSASA